MTPPADATYAYTHLRPSGNRVLDGSGAVLDADPVELQVDGTPAWLLAFGGDASTLWTVVTADGSATTHRVRDGGSEQVADHGAISTPPLAYRLDDGQVALADAPADMAGRTHPVVLEDGLLSVAADGDVVLRRDGSATRFDVGAPDDVRIVAVGDGRYALYGDRTDRYTHGALGDTTEGSSLVVVDAAAGAVESEVALDPPAVFEGLSPLVADLDGDGEAEIVTTIATSADGARIRVYDTDGTAVATGPVYGPGWRHQLCVAPFAPDGSPELAVVLKPHVTRTLEFYRLDGGDLSVAATLDGYSTHTYGSRNLDGALAADLDADGRPELLLPTSDRRTLEAVRRVEGGAETVGSLPLGGSLATNVAGVGGDDGRLAVGAGTGDAVRVWQG